ncbi:macrolide ABC transporter ATP-binding protein [Rhizobium sp. Leaf384]|uniref:MacB family efflux pump subunit n=1 Tax=unclassified Rhizobium TaxID=2613769 RepID=UPI000713F3F5|nr:MULTISPECIES: MacB family efflux pump subunit [unclassified Rhizobium]KQR78147.1 macrolide ABC transporter ATP-binding protein [Rhizobium sp. Leaf341]KQS81360.1 macrolide ABC transporter ATP-binding protein [Rhizobium sp. Leaf384]KQS87269.1 macrolide ABC transporter ATP-binding protein [Rhizobium sp. Leaf383]
MTPLISLKNIRKTFMTGDVPVDALRGVSLDIQPGEFVAIVGQSGSGKSTLMNILGCLDQPTGGAYHLDGEDVAGFDADQLAERRRQMFGFVFQSYNLVATSTARENVEIPAIYAGVSAKRREARSRELLEALRLGDRMDHLPNQLSGGQQQRVSIARALMNGGQIILADEPTGALDSQSGKDVMATLRRMNEDGHTVIIITHAPDLAESADRVIEIRDGLIVADRLPRRISRPVRPAPRVFATQAGKAALFSDVAEAVRMSFRALRANFFRTVLTLLGIVIGVSSVVAMLAIGTGAQNQVLSRIAAMGSDLLVIRPNMANFRGGEGGSVVSLVPADADAILELPNISFAVPEMSSSLTVRAGNLDTQTTVNGTVPQFPEAKTWSLAEGAFIAPADMRSYATVAVLGKTVADTLFPDGADPLGQYILIKNIPFQVIGVMAPKGATAGGNDQDDTVLVPLSTGNLRLFGARNVRSITVQVKDDSAINITQDQIQALLDERHQRQDTQIANLAAIREAFTETSNILKVFLGSIAAISLLVGGIGVMNIMLVSVTERTREIGIRMATGARGRDILTQFIVEALVVSALGGIIGVGLGLSIGLIAQSFGVPVTFSAGPVLLAFASAFVTGLVFGYLPAHNASRLQPAVALSAP